MKKNIPFLTLVTNKNNITLDKYLKFLEICANYGIDSVQLREKHLNKRELFELATIMLETLTPLNISLIINDNPELAHKVGAAGVHLGQDDGNVFKARKLLGDNKIIGLTVNSLEQLKLANELPINYVGVGAIFPTKNKPNVKTIWKCKGLKQCASISNKPILAIGGIDESNIEEVLLSGARGIAAIGAFHNAYDPAFTTKTLHNHIRKFYHA